MHSELLFRQRPDRPLGFAPVSVVRAAVLLIQGPLTIGTVGHTRPNPM